MFYSATFADAQRQASTPQIIIRVYLDPSEKRSVDVPVTPESTCHDLLDCIREPGVAHCHLTEIWRGCERRVADHEHLYSLLQEWGLHRDEVRFYLREDIVLDPGLTDVDDVLYDDDVRMRKKPRGGGSTSPSTAGYHGMPGGGSEMSLAELQDMASRQQQQIENQQQVLVAKEQRLMFLRQQENRREHVVGEQERLRKLKERVQEQELKLKKLRALRGQVEQHRLSNGNLNSELESIKALFNEKEKELALAVAKVDELTTQLEDLRNGKIVRSNGDHFDHSGPELDRLRQELALRNKLNEQQSSKLAAQREVLHQRKSEIAQMDKRIYELQQRLRKRRTLMPQKKLIDGHHNAATGPLKAPASQPRNIATIEPYMKHTLKDQPISGNSGTNNTEQLMRKAPLAEADDDELKSHDLPDGAVQRYQHNEMLRDKNYTVPLIVNVNDKHQKDVSVSAPSTTTITQTVTYQRTPASIANFAAKPFGSTYSTSMLANGSLPSSRLVSSAPRPPPPAPPQSGPAIIQDEPRTDGSGQSSPATSDNSSAGSNTPGSVPPGQQNYPQYNRQTAQRVPASSMSNQQSHPPIPSNQSREPHSANLPPTLQRIPHNAQPPWPSVPHSTHLAQPPRQSVPPGGQVASSTSRPTSSNNDTNYKQSIPPPHSNNHSVLQQIAHSGQGQRPDQKPVSASALSSSSSSQSALQGSSTTSNNQKTNAYRPLFNSKALPSKSNGIVTNNTNQSSGVSPVKNPPRFASRSVIANTYTQKLGSSAMENYRKTMSALYKDLTPSASSEGGDGASQNSSSPAESVSKFNDNMAEAQKSEAQNKITANNMDVRPTPQQLADSTAGRNTSQSSIKPTLVKPDSGPAAAGGRGISGVGVSGVAMLTPVSDKASYKLNTPKYLRRRHSDSDSEDQAKSSHKHSPDKTTAGSPQKSDQNSQPNTAVISVVKPQQNSNANEMENKKKDLNDNDSTSVVVTSIEDAPQQLMIDAMGNVLEVRDDTDYSVPPQDYSVTSGPSDLSSSQSPTQSGPYVSSSGPNYSTQVVKRKKTNLKSKDSSSCLKSSRRVSFDPLALLLDASLEGELDLVMKTSREVPDVSKPNDEGITALHNAICAGHYDVIKFLIEFGADVNTPDSDGWTPLHCAASCNNLPMVRQLVENGACIFATTISDHETPAEKCEEDEDGYDCCSEYLYNIQEKLGIINSGVVFAVFDYQMQNLDELTFQVNDKMTVLRKGDEKEKEWWWASSKGREGYLPRNLLGLHPRVMPNRERS